MKAETKKEEALLHTCKSLIKIIDGVLDQRNNIDNKTFIFMEDAMRKLKKSLLTN